MALVHDYLLSLRLCVREIEPMACVRVCVTIEGEEGEKTESTGGFGQ